MTTRGLLDTSTVVLLPRTDDASELPDDPHIGTITLAELSVGPLVATDVQERAARQSVLQQAERNFDPVPFDAAVARAFGRVAAALRAASRKPSARSLDALVAATAISQGIPVFACNPRDFDAIDELDLRAVLHPDTVGR